jgi:hypothetical protein
MSTLEKLKAWAEDYKRDLCTVVHVDKLLEKISQLEAAEVKEWPDSDGTWWQDGQNSPWFYVYIDSEGIPRTLGSVEELPKGRWIKADKPTFPESENWELPSHVKERVKQWDEEHAVEDSEIWTKLGEIENQLRAEHVELQNHVLKLAAKVNGLEKSVEKLHEREKAQLVRHINLSGKVLTMEAALKGHSEIEKKVEQLDFRTAGQVKFGAVPRAPTMTEEEAAEIVERFESEPETSDEPPPTDPPPPPRVFGTWNGKTGWYDAQWAAAYYPDQFVLLGSDYYGADPFGFPTEEQARKWLEEART